MSHAYIQIEDIGLTVLGTTQYGYTVNGVHGQDFDTAVYRAALCRSVGVEGALTAYNKLLVSRQKKLDALGAAMAGINEAVAKVSKPKTDTEISLGSDVVSTLRTYGFSSVARKMQYKDIVKLQQDVQYAVDREDNEVQQDMSAMQSFITKRDDAMQMAAKLMKKVAQTRSRGINHIGS